MRLYNEKLERKNKTKAEMKFHKSNVCLGLGGAPPTDLLDPRYVFLSYLFFVSSLVKIYQ